MKPKFQLTLILLTLSTVLAEDLYNTRQSKSNQNLNEKSNPNDSKAIDVEDVSDSERQTSGLRRITRIPMTRNAIESKFSDNKSLVNTNETERKPAETAMDVRVGEVLVRDDYQQVLDKLIEAGEEDDDKEDDEEDDDEEDDSDSDQEEDDEEDADDDEEDDDKEDNDEKMQKSQGKGHKNKKHQSKKRKGGLKHDHNHKKHKKYSGPRYPPIDKDKLYEVGLLLYTRDFQLGEY